MKVHRVFSKRSNMDAWFEEHFDDPGVAYVTGSLEYRWKTHEGDDWTEKQSFVVFELDGERG